jgi:formylglycine-generating enzyme
VHESRSRFLVGAMVVGAAFAVTVSSGCARLTGESALAGTSVTSAGLAAVVSKAASHAPTRSGEERGARVQPAEKGSRALGSSFDPDTPVDQLLGEGDRPLAGNGLCPPDMASIEDRFCVDRFEASLVEILPSGEERPWAHYLPVEGHVVRAVSERGAMPQGYVSEKQAKEACGRSGKRLCRAAEWKTACRGPEQKRFGYSDQLEAGRCNDHGRAPLGDLMSTLGGAAKAGNMYTWDKMNHPMLNQVDGTLAPTGSHEGCTNGYGVYDMVGNLHEWVDDASGVFQGGYYLDIHQNGDGCGYKTDAHNTSYHDYSTGFRCCADVAQ